MKLRIADVFLVCIQNMKQDKPIVCFLEILELTFQVISLLFCSVQTMQRYIMQKFLLSLKLETARHCGHLFNFNFIRSTRYGENTHAYMAEPTNMQIKRHNQFLFNLVTATLKLGYCRSTTF